MVVVVVVVVVDATGSALDVVEVLVTVQSNHGCPVPLCDGHVEVTGFDGFEEVVAGSTGSSLDVVDDLVVTVQSSHGLSVPLCAGQLDVTGL